MESMFKIYKMFFNQQFFIESTVVELVKIIFFPLIKLRKLNFPIFSARLSVGLISS